jgi:hypothetical protein
MCGRCLLHPQSENAPGIGDERTRINNVVVDGYDDYDRCGGGDVLDVSDGKAIMATWGTQAGIFEFSRYTQSNTTH